MVRLPFESSSLVLLALLVLGAGCEQSLSPLQPELSVEPAVLDFGSVTQGATLSDELTFTVFNTGEGSTRWTSVHIDGAAPGVFQLVPEELPLADDLLPRESARSFTVVATPAGVGAFLDTVRIETRDHDPLEVELRLEILEAPLPAAALRPSSLDFGTVDPGSSVTAEAWVDSVGEAPLSLESLVLVGDGAFALAADPSPALLAPGESAPLTLRFTAPPIGAASAELEVRTDDPRVFPDESEAGLLRMPLLGGAAGVPDIEVDPPSVDFGPVPTGDAVSAVVEVRNVGSVDLNLLDVGLSGSPLFALESAPVGAVVEPGAAETVSLRYTSDGNESRGELLIVSDDPDEPSYAVPLSAGFLPVPAIAIDPPALDFGVAVVGDTITLPLTVSSVGTGLLDVSEVRLTGTSWFSMATVLPGPLLPGASTVISIEFSPVDVGLAAGSVTVHSDDPAQPVVEVPMSGLVERPPDIAVDPLVVDFGGVEPGITVSQLVSIQNVGGRELWLDALMLSAPPAFSFAPDTGGRFLAPGESTWTQLYFHPDATGPLSGQLGVLSDDPDEPSVVVEILGEGVGEPDIALTPPLLDFGAVPVGDSASRVAVLQNVGTAPLNVLGITPGGDPSFAFAGGWPGVVGPGESWPAEIVFSPDRSGVLVGSLEVESDDPDEPSLTLALVGGGTGGPDIDVDPGALHFGPLLAGDSATAAVTISNLGTLPLTLSSVSLAGDGAFTSPLGLDGTILAPGGAVALPIHFAPPFDGGYSGSLVVQSDDPDESVVVVPLAGSGEGEPDIQVSPLALDFGVVEAGSSSDRVVHIANLGLLPLTLGTPRLSGGGPFLLPSGLDGLVIPGGAVTSATLSYSPTGPALDMGELVIVSDDPDEPEVLVSLVGQSDAATPEEPPPPGFGGPCPEGHVVSLGRTLAVLAWGDTRDSGTITLSSGERGWYDVYDSYLAESGASQFNESAFLRISNPENPSGHPWFANCGSDYVVVDADNSGASPWARIYVGTFWLEEGVNDIELRHYCPRYRAGRCTGLHQSGHWTTCNSGDANSAHLDGTGLCLVKTP